MYVTSGKKINKLPLTTQQCTVCRFKSIVELFKHDFMAPVSTCHHAISMVYFHTFKNGVLNGWNRTGFFL